MNQQYNEKELFLFNILNTMHKNKEKINAEILAKKAKMGKQTVLPYYQLWKKMMTIGDDVNLEIPDHLIASLKLLLSQWKIDISESIIQLKTDNQKKINQYEQQLIDVQNKLNIEQSSLNEVQIKYQNLQKQVEDKNLILAETQTKLTHQTELNIEKNIEINDLKNQIIILEKDYQDKLYQLEEKLNHQYQKQLDYWIKTLDQERQNNLNTENKYLDLKQSTLKLQNDNNQLEEKLNKHLQKNSKLYEEQQILKDKLKDYDQFKDRLKVINHVNHDNLGDLINAIIEKKEIMINLQQELEKTKEKLKLSTTNGSVLEKKYQDVINELHYNKQELAQKNGYIKAFTELKNNNGKKR